MKMIEAMTQDLRDEGIITGLKHWVKGDNERTYIQVTGYSHSYRGCKTHQLYWDHKAGRLVNEYGKGTRPDAFDASVQRVVDAFAE